MADNKITDEDLLKTYETYLRTGSTRKTAKELGLKSKSSVLDRLNQAKRKFNLDYKKPVVSGAIEGFKTVKSKLPSEGTIKRYIVSSAQNNTHVHHEFFENLIAYADYMDAELLVSQYTYNKSAYGKKSVKPGTEPTKEDLADIWYDPILDEYICNDRVGLAPDLVFCGEQNILPTAVRPLSGFESYPGQGASAIFPHTTIAMESIASLDTSRVKMNYTTGCVTQQNYIQKKAGLKAEHHHIYGALIVEVDSSGEWWVRQINATDDGSFYDLDCYVCGCEVEEGKALEAINWGDIHVESIDEHLKRALWGEGGVLDQMRPAYQFMHDTVDFHARNHHIAKNPHAKFERWVNGKDNVKSEFERVRDFLGDYAYRPWCKTVVVDSNHDNAFERWLREADYKTDPKNAEFFLECQLEKYRAIRSQDKNHHLVEAVLRGMGLSSDIKFLRRDESFLLCGAIECGLHGDMGPNGARGTPMGISKLGYKVNMGHSHSAAIIQGTYVAGTSTLLRLEYNKGPSSWSHSLIFTYPNAKRAIITMRNGKYRA